MVFKHMNNTKYADFVNVNSDHTQRMGMVAVDWGNQDIWGRPSDLVITFI